MVGTVFGQIHVEMAFGTLFQKDLVSQLHKLREIKYYNTHSVHSVEMTEVLRSCF